MRLVRGLRIGSTKYAGIEIVEIRRVRGKGWWMLKEREWRVVGIA
jgi:hypothetical protein